MAVCVLANADVSTVSMSNLAKTIMDDFRLSAGIESDGRPPASTPHVVSIGPNPLGTNATMSIRIAVPGDGWVRLEAFDVAGRIVSTLANGRYAAGDHDVPWSPAQEGLAPGVYFIRFASPGTSDFLRVVVAQ
jgi:hypothetical protein